MATRSNIFVHNLGWKLLSLVLASFTWLTIQTEFQREKKTDQESRENPMKVSSSKSFPAVTITLLSSPGNTNHYKVTPDTAQVEIGGDEQQLRALQPREVAAYVDLTDVQDEKQFRRPVQIRIPHDFNIISV